MTVIVTGGRHYKGREHVWRVLDELQPTIVIQGGATGADEWARAWCNSRGVQCITFNANWQYWMQFPGVNQAGFKRNANMFSLWPGPIDLCVAFPGGNGTADCVERAHSNHVKVRMEEEA